MLSQSGHQHTSRAGNLHASKCNGLLSEWKQSPFHPEFSQGFCTRALTSLFSYHQLNEARNTYDCRSELMVIHDEIMVLLRDPDILIADMIQWMVQCTMKMPIQQCQMEHSITRETSHLAGILVLIPLFRPHLAPLLLIVGTCCRLAAFVPEMDSAVLCYFFPPVSD